MSLIHLEKSVVTFHLKEILEDGSGNHPLAWLGLGILVLAPPLLTSLAQGTQPSPASVKRKSSPWRNQEISLSEWVEQAKKRELLGRSTFSAVAPTGVQLIQVGRSPNQ